MRFRKQPVEIEAFRWQNEPTPDWFEDALKKGSVTLLSSGSDLPIYAQIKTLEGTMLANPGDWIIRGIMGEIYPCKPDIFEKSYEPVVDAVIDTWKGNWIITVEAPNGRIEARKVDKMLVDLARDQISLLQREADDVIVRLWERRDEVNPND